jgi:hypothetical protein
MAIRRRKIIEVMKIMKENEIESGIAESQRGGKTEIMAKEMAYGENNGISGMARKTKASAAHAGTWAATGNENAAIMKNIESSK